MKEKGGKAGRVEQGLEGEWREERGEGVKEQGGRDCRDDEAHNNEEAMSSGPAKSTEYCGKPVAALQRHTL